MANSIHAAEIVRLPTVSIQQGTVAESTLLSRTVFFHAARVGIWPLCVRIETMSEPPRDLIEQLEKKIEGTEEDEDI